MSILIGYSSCEGQSHKIAQYIAERLHDQEITWFNLDKPSLWPDPAEFDNVLLAASIRYGFFRKHLDRYVERYTDVLQSRPSAFMGVCLTARKPGKDDPNRSVYMVKFAKKHQWRPDRRAMFAGALCYSRYTWWQTLLIQMIMKMTGGSTDKSADIEFTDWQKVKHFSDELNQLFTKSVG